MALTQSISVDILEKKVIWNKAATGVEREYFEEPYSSSLSILSGDIWLQSDELPNTAATVSGLLSLVTATLSYVEGTKGSYVNTNLKNAVPSGFGDGDSYRWKVYRNNGSTEIYPGEGLWMFDNGSGVLNFHSATSNGLVYNGDGVIIASQSAPPVMQVWKYEGKLGVLPNIGSGLTYSGGTLSVSPSVLGNYLEYKALISQSGTASPTENILVNSLTGTWSYVSDGIYYFTSAGNFTDITKVEVYIPGVTILGYAMSNNLFHIKSAARFDNNTIEVRTGLLTNFYADKYVTFDTAGGASSDILKNDVLSYTPITIRVWS
jgi:hypothetical protein